MAKKSVNVADRITSLPRSIIDHILERLPLRDAVRTSGLSKDWRYKWLTIPSLVIDRDFEKSLHGRHDLESIVSFILLLHKGTIAKFSLTGTSIGSCPALNHWLHFLLNHGTTVLTLQLPCWNATKVMPHHLFDFHQLTELNLENVEIRPPSTYREFNSLVRLNLLGVTIDPMLLKRFISMCPKLEFLNMENVYQTKYSDNDPVIVLDVPPAVRSFRYWSGTNVLFSFDNAVCLEELSISYDLYSTSTLFHEKWSCSFIDFFSQFSSIHTLDVNTGFLKLVGSHAFLPKNLPNDLKHLTLLHFSDLDLGMLSIVECAICLVRSSPNMQRLEIEFITDISPEDMVNIVRYLNKIQEDSNVPICSNLKYVKIESFMGYGPELEFVKLLLSSAPLLEKLVVKSMEDINKFQVLKGLARFSRASAHAVMEFD